MLLLGGLEAALRLAGYGFCTRLFRKSDAGGGRFLINNDSFSWRFFPPQLARSTGPIRLAASKPADAYRIFILGESAAMGDPDPTFGASRYLEAMLSARYPKTQFEVVNLGITAINSHVILPIARECAEHEGDLWIVYMGNNEMVGPFGASTVFGPKAPPLPAIRFNLALQQTRLGQWLVRAARSLKGAEASLPSWGGMEMFVGNQIPARDPRREVVYRNFQCNLHDILKAGVDSGARILLNTVAVNLRDCPPFASLSNSNLAGAERRRLELLCAEAARGEEQGAFAAAARAWEQAAQLDPTAAALQYHWAQSLARLSNAAAAREHFQLACDCDALPFRADSRINAIIEGAAQKLGSSNVVLFDAASALAADGDGQLCGEETFYEHVHFNFNGSYRLGRAWAEQIARLLPAAIASQAAGGWPARASCERRLGLTEWNRALVLQHVVKRLQQAPLSSQPNNAERLRHLQEQLEQLQPQLTAAALARARQGFAEALGAVPNDYLLRENYALFLQSIEEIEPAAAEWRRIRELIPQDFFACFQVGKLLGMRGRWAEAEEALQQAVELRPGMSEGWSELGRARAGAGKLEPALESYGRALQQRPGDAQTLLGMGRALGKLNRHAQAIEKYRAVIQQYPASWEAHFELGGELDLANQLDAAREEFAAAARLKPDNSRAHFNYGVLLAKQTRFDEARREFEETLRLEPGYQNARLYLAQLQSKKP